MKLLTTGEIAKQLNADRDRVSYALRKLDITPSGIAGNTRVYPETALVAIEEFLSRRSQKESKQNHQRIDSGDIKNIRPCDQVGRNYE